MLSMVLGYVCRGLCGGGGGGFASGFGVCNNVFLIFYSLVYLRRIKRSRSEAFVWGLDWGLGIEGWWWRAGCGKVVIIIIITIMAV